MNRFVWPVSVAASSVLAALCTLAQVPGSLDTAPLPAFATGNGKISNLDISGNQDRAHAVAVQSDGKIVMAGDCVVGGQLDFCLARRNADGSQDNSFSDDGKVIFPATDGIGDGDDYVYAMTIQPDGKILVAGSCFSPTFRKFCVARLNTDGSFDTSFDGDSGVGDGRLVLNVGNGSHALVNAIALQPDGKIVLAGGCGLSSPNSFCAARLLPDGRFDLDFVGTVPFQTVGAGRVRLTTTNGGTINAVAIQPDGKIVFAGECTNGSGNEDFCVARINANGAIDLDFDGSASGNGMLVFAMGTGDDVATSALIQPDNRILVAGHCQTSATADMCVIRLETDGTLDPHFDGPAGNGNGKLMLSQIGIGTERAYAMALQPDGKILLVGDCAQDFCVARLHPDGALDQSFDGPSGVANGWFSLAIGSGIDYARALALQPDGKILVVGYCVNTNSDFCIARLNGGAFGAKQCLPDFDGDGTVSATVDALILTRVALGMRGSDVLNGIGFAAAAKRTDWVSIRDYLFSQCGMSVY
jgi:uncharacterized delta-60 repeat protein